MKKIIVMFALTCVLMLSASCFAGYKESYNEANKFYIDRNFVEAEAKYTESIDFQGTALAYFWRAKSRFELEKFQQAYFDFFTAEIYAETDSWIIKESRKFRYYCLMMQDPANYPDSYYAHYAQCNLARKDWLALEDTIKIEHVGDEIIVSNIKDDMQRRVIAKSMVHFNFCTEDQICEDKDNGDLVIKKKCDCGCSKKDVRPEHIETCKDVCTSVCYAGQIALIIYAKKIPGPVSTALGMVLDFIEDECKKCCETEGSLKDCYDSANESAKKIYEKIADWMSGETHTIIPENIS